MVKKIHAVQKNSLSEVQQKRQSTNSVKTPQNWFKTSSCHVLN